MIERIYIDIDEVLADFVGGMARRWGKTREEVEAHWTPGVWDMTIPLSKARRREEVMTSKEFWSLVKFEEAFWVKLKPTSWLEQLMEKVVSITSEWYLVSTPSLCSTSYSGKAKWVEEHLSKYHPAILTRLKLMSNKPLLASRNSVLIDDREETVYKFIERGGYGIIFPALHNSLHTQRHDPLRHVNELLHDFQHCK